ncbi:MAG: prolipoprotein diacylglyceryl transferase, partial [Bacteroidales bacterium]|nr:prolipoprotein diacylglyceryl transferase [Bacteroidales bacterium]
MNTLYIIWNVSPEIFHIGDIAIRWYGLLFALAFLFGYLIMAKFFKAEKLPSGLLDTLATYMFLGTVIGARLGHCLFYEPASYLSNPIDILKIWEGGLASHGGAIGILIALYLFSRNHKKPYLWLLDRIVILVALAGFFIRTGNLMNSEIYGHTTNLPWAFVFVRDDLLPRHPTQIYEALACLIIFLFLYILFIKKGKKLNMGVISALFLILLFSV